MRSDEPSSKHGKAEFEGFARSIALFWLVDAEGPAEQRLARDPDGDLVGRRPGFDGGHRLDIGGIGLAKADAWIEPNLRWL